MEGLLEAFAHHSAQLIEGAAVLVVAFASLGAFVRLVWTTVTMKLGHGQRKAIWQRYGMWLLLGLEFELAADIIRSVVSPTWQDLGELGAIAVIRTFLNYFLEKDLETASRAD
jgi:uncharacterized membrane protein